MTTNFPMTMYGINEARPGPRWKALFDAVWPGYRRWYLSEGADARPDPETAEARLRRHMPELVPTWQRLVRLTGDDPLAATMLTLWDPPMFAPGCSQVVVPGPTPTLVRNYDYAPELFEQVVISTAYEGRKVIGTSDCLWGLLDGVNDAGLAVSLAYGGRAGSAPGFAAPLVVRYLLEVAGSTAEARQRLAGLPVSMSYNLTMVDASGDATTAFVTPGEEPTFFAAAATNHRGDVPERPDHARRFRSVERRQALTDAVADELDAESVADRFLQPPLFNDDYAGAFGTLYTAVYRPVDGTVEYRWPGARWVRAFDAVDDTFTVVLGAPPVPVVVPTEELSRTVAELGARTRADILSLAQRPERAALTELLGLYAVLGAAVGESAQRAA